MMPNMKGFQLLHPTRLKCFPNAICHQDVSLLGSHSSFKKKPNEIYIYPIQHRCTHNAPSDHDEEGDQHQTWSRSQKDNFRKNYEHKQSEYNEKAENGEYNNLTKISEVMNHYQRLDIQQNASSDEIKSAYYSLSKRYHPDIVGNDPQHASDNFRLITESYDTLIDPKRRAIYDSTLIPKNEATYVDLKGFDRGNYTNRVYDQRTTEYIFRMHREAAIQEEKRKNPAKFRAGVFKPKDISDKDRDFIVTQRLKQLREDLIRNRSYNKDDQFYRHHFENSVRRRISSFEDFPFRRYYNESHFDSVSESSPFIVSSLMVIGFAGVVLWSLVNFDLPSYLDDQVELYKEKLRKPKLD